MPPPAPTFVSDDVAEKAQQRAEAGSWTPIVKLLGLYLAMAASERFEQSTTLVTPPLGQFRIAASDQPLVGEIRVRHLKQIPLVE